MKESLKEVQVNQIISQYDHVDGGWYWAKYAAGPYLGCSYDCVYCYNLGSDDGQIQIKQDAVKKFREELSQLPKDVIILGDYQPAESKLRMIRAMLEIVADLGFPLHIVEKSPLVTNDLDIIKETAKKSWAAISMSVTAAPSRPNTVADLTLFEPTTPIPDKRFEAMAKVSSAGILTGTMATPVIPFIGDGLENIEAAISATKEAGGSYFIIGGLIIPEPLDQLFWDVLGANFSHLVAKMRRLYDVNNIDEYRSYFGELDRETSKLCAKYDLLDHIPRPVDHYPKELQMNKLLAEHFYLAARFAKANGLSIKKEQAYLAVAWLLDDLKFNVVKAYNDRGLKMLLDLGLEKKLAKEVETVIKSAKIKGANFKVR